MKHDTYFPTLRCSYNPSSKNYFGFDVPTTANKHIVRLYLRAGYGFSCDRFAINSLPSRVTKMGRRLVIKHV